MSRFPNPWVTIPTAVSGLAGALVGFFVTDASCAPESCVPLALSVGGLSGLIAAAGVGVVVVLAVRSMAEWRHHAEREITVVRDTDEAPGPPTC